MNGLRAKVVAGGAALALSVLSLSGCRSTGAPPAAAPPAAVNPEEARKAVLDRDAEKIRAMVQADAKALGEILRDDLTYIHSSGPLEDKPKIIDEIASGLLQYKAVETSELGVRVYGDSAVLTGRAVLKVSTKGKALEIPVRFSEVWVRTNGVWQLASWQATRIP